MLTRDFTVLYGADINTATCMLLMSVLPRTSCQNIRISADFSSGVSKYIKEQCVLN